MARACWPPPPGPTPLALHATALGLVETLLGTVHDRAGLVQEAAPGVRLARRPIDLGHEGQNIGDPHRGIGGAVEGHPLVHRGNLLGWLVPGRTRPALEDQGHPEPIAEALLAADARGGFRMLARLLPVPPELMEDRQLGERLGEGMGMRQVLRTRARLVAPPEGLVRIVQGPQSEGVIHQGRDPRVLAISEGERAVLLGIIQRHTPGKLLAGLGHFPHVVPRHAQGSVGPHEGVRVPLELSEVQKLLGLVTRLPILAADTERTEAIQDRGRCRDSPSRWQSSHARANVCSASGEA